MTGWLLATQARLGMTGEARAALAALDDQRASSGEISNADAVICLAEGDPAGALAAVADVLDGTAPVLGSTVMEAHLLAGLAHRELGDQRAASQAAERALALAEADRLILPFAMTGSAGLLEALPRHETAHAALLADILDVPHGSSPAAQEPSWSPPADELSPGELRVLRYPPTNLSRPEIAGELSVSPNTVNAHIRSIYAKLGVGDRFFLSDYIAVESTNSKAPDALHRQWPEGHGRALDPGRHLRTGTPHAEADPPESARQQYGWALSSAPQPQLSRREGPQNQAAWTLPQFLERRHRPALHQAHRGRPAEQAYARLELTIPNQSFQYRTAVLRAAVPRWLTTLCDQWQTQMRLQCPAERQALADGNPLRVIADPGLEAQPRSAGSR